MWQAHFSQKIHANRIYKKPVTTDMSNHWFLLYTMLVYSNYVTRWIELEESK